MKKIIYFILLLIPIIVNASVSSITPVVPRCSYVTNNRAIISVDLVSLNDGFLSKELDEYQIGLIYHKDLDIKIDELSSKIVKNIKVDYMTDENDLSKVYFILKNDKDIKSMESIATFDINIIFNSDIPNKINILGNNVILSKDRDICKNINKYNNSYTSERSIYLNKNLSIYYMIIGVLIIIILVLLKKGGNDNALYKNKNKQRSKR